MASKPEPVCSGGLPQDKERLIRERFRDKYKAVSECLNYEELVPVLCEEFSESQLFSFEDSDTMRLIDSSIKQEKKLSLLTEKLDRTNSYTKLLDCLQREEEHLGHAYICALLEGRQYGSECEVAYSRAVKNGITKKVPRFTKGLSLNELGQHLVQYKVLTFSERDLLRTIVSRNEQNFKLMSIIKTKGPLGYSLFAKCLHDEDSHKTHGELYDLIHKDMDSSLLPEEFTRKRKHEDKSVTTFCRKIFCRLRLHGVLQGKKYDKMIATFQTFQYNGEWAEMEAEASKYLREGVCCELQIAVLLEKAVGLVFQGSKQEEPYRLITEAKEKCKQIDVDDDNSTFLKGRCEYTLAILYKYFKQYDKAKEHSENAIQILFTVEQGHDTAHASLNYASLLMLESGESQMQKAKEFLRTAICDATEHGSGINPVVPHSYMRMAQLLIGSVHSSNAGPQDQERVCSIQDADECLKRIEPDTLSYRSRCRFYLMQSNLYYCKGMRSESEQAAKHGLELAEQYNKQKPTGGKSSCDKILDSFDFYCFKDK